MVRKSFQKEENGLVGKTFQGGEDDRVLVEKMHIRVSKWCLRRRIWWFG